MQAREIKEQDKHRLEDAEVTGRAPTVGKNEIDEANTLTQLLQPVFAVCAAR